MKKLLFLLTIAILSFACSKEDQNPENQFTRVILEYEVISSTNQTLGHLINYDFGIDYPGEKFPYQSLLTPDATYTGYIKHLKNENYWKLDTLIPFEATHVNFNTLAYNDSECLEKVYDENLIFWCNSKSDSTVSVIVTISTIYIIEGKERKKSYVRNLSKDNSESCTITYEEGEIISTSCREIGGPSFEGRHSHGLNITYI